MCHDLIGLSSAQLVTLIWGNSSTFSIQLPVVGRLGRGCLSSPRQQQADRHRYSSQIRRRGFPLCGIAGLNLVPLEETAKYRTITWVSRLHIARPDITILISHSGYRTYIIRQTLSTYFLPNASRITSSTAIHHQRQLLRRRWHHSTDPIQQGDRVTIHNGKNLPLT